MAESRDDAKTSSQPPPSVRVGKLDSAPRIRQEARRLYIAARKGEVQPADASRLGSLLALIASLARDSQLNQLEARIVALEATRAMQP